MEDESCESADRKMLRGGCLCGAVEFQVHDAFVFAVNCHCADCRRTTGAAFKPLARIAGAKLAIIRGEQHMFLYGSGDAGNVNCGICGSLLFSRVEGDFVHVAMGTLIDAPSISPTDHIFVGSKAPWFTITDTLPQHQAHIGEGLAG